MTAGVMYGVDMTHGIVAIDGEDIESYLEGFGVPYNVVMYFADAVLDIADEREYFEDKTLDQEDEIHDLKADIEKLTQEVTELKKALERA